MTGTEPTAEVLKREAYAWLARLTSGDATAADAAAFDRWRTTSPAHGEAFSEAKLLWKVMRPAAEVAMSQRGDAVPGMAFGRTNRWHRRAFLGGAAAASVASVAYLAVRPPLGLWSSVAELSSDYRTGTGEQKRIALADSISVQLNTRTSLSLGSAMPGADHIELVSGEAAIATGVSLPRPLVVTAGDGRVTARRATFNIRYLDASACVTCQDGEVTVERRGSSVTLQPLQQVSYSTEGLDQVVAIDASVVTAWQQGLLIFRHAPLADVVAEVNRYRRGRIILMNDALGHRLVFANFRIDRIEEVVPRLQAAFSLRTTNLPGDIVLLS
ncbi:sigma factor regulator VreR [Aliidongia dinghuensis]|uniref:Sigma factor regulator VreR n=1 Tax=Aliidongia dinghuensis TaxID=1867774 RepID=A0A8J2YYK9_9PROT|nr:FecR domain-containing protein [Aliidongia dinghuensis]GGF37228.1 sigma factor regulator VreR [Aliidongia dinghuensis]